MLGIVFDRDFHDGQCRRKTGLGMQPFGAGAGCGKPLVVIRELLHQLHGSASAGCGRHRSRRRQRLPSSSRWHSRRCWQGDRCALPGLTSSCLEHQWRQALGCLVDGLHLHLQGHICRWHLFQFKLQHMLPRP